MSKSHAKRQRNNFVRGVRAESALRAYTITLGYLQTRDHAAAVKLVEERIAFCRSELRACNQRREATCRTSS